MQQSSPSYRESYQAATVADAARILGVSESTVRRLVRTGRLEAERVERPQGHAWLVRVPAPATDQPGTSQHLGATTPANPSAMAAWVSSVLDPLVLELRMSRETIAEQAEKLGYVTAERDAARTELAALKGGARATFSGRVLAPWLLGSLAIVGLVVLLAWHW